MRYEQFLTIKEYRHKNGLIDAVVYGFLTKTQFQHQQSFYRWRPSVMNASFALFDIQGEVVFVRKIDTLP